MPSSPLTVNTCEVLLWQVGAGAVEVGLAIQASLALWFFGEVLRVLPQRVPGAFELTGALSPGRSVAPLQGRPRPYGSLRIVRRRRSGPPPFGVQCFRWPRPPTWNRSAHSTAGQAALGDHRGISRRHQRGMGDLSSALVARGVEEPPGGLASRGGPAAIGS